tara:strand:+ start:847 stop:1077 length:231 start_codon:yes stop_codon:yes gene_type:complete
MDIKQFRQQLKKVGGKVSIQSLSFGSSATIKNLQGDKMPMMFFNDEDLARWLPIINCIEDCKPVTYYGDKIYGLTK